MFYTDLHTEKILDGLQKPIWEWYIPADDKRVQKAAEEALEKYHDTFRELGKE